jgi:hypothetical protein
LATTRSGSPTNNLVANNFVYNIRSNGGSGDQPAGIGWANGHSDKIVFNSISMFGDMDPGAAASPPTYGNGIRVTAVNGTNNANLTLKNNSIHIDATSSSNPALRYYAIALPSATYSFGTGGIGNNNYYRNAANPQTRLGGVGTATAVENTSTFDLLSDWTAAFTSDVGSISSDPLYLSGQSDLHILIASPNNNAGVMTPGISDDLDGHTRSDPPDIGADEFLAPTFAAVRLGGRVTDSSGRGVRNVVITVTGGFSSETRTTATGSMGYYDLDGLSPGTYIVAVKAKRLSVSEPVRMIALVDSIVDFDFVADLSK